VQGHTDNRQQTAPKNHEARNEFEAIESPESKAAAGAYHSVNATVARHLGFR